MTEQTIPMGDEKAARIIGLLVGGTTGWTDDAVLAYVTEIRTHSDPDAMLAAVRQIMRTWTEARRPPLALILEGYRSELARRQPPPERTISGRRVPPSEGIEIARRAYEAECRREGREPNHRLFDRLATSIGRRP